jgi:pilus assembly protein Flp/PilA
MLRLVQRVLREEEGGEVLEYALIIGLVVVVVITAISSVGTKVFALWTSLNDSL